MKKNIKYQYDTDLYEQALGVVESGEDILNLFDNISTLQGVGKAVSSTITAVDALGKFVPIVKILLSGILTGVLFAKYLNKFRKKEVTNLRVAASVVNLAIPIILIGTGIAALIFPGLLAVLTLAAICAGVGREGFNFFKTLHNQLESSSKLTSLEKELSEGEHTLNPKEIAALRKEYVDFSFKHSVRNWKIAHRGTDLLIGALSIAAVVVVIAVGPYGWAALAGIALIGLAVKVGMTLVKNYRINKLRAQQIKLMKPGDISYKPEKRELEEQEVDRDSKRRKLKHHHQNTKEIISEFANHPANPQESEEQLLQPEADGEIDEKHLRSDVQTLAREQHALFEDAPKEQSCKVMDAEKKIDEKTPIKSETEDEEGRDDEGESPKF